MTWIISQALYEKWHCSQEQAVESSEDTFLDGKQSAPLNGSLTQLAYLPLDKMTKFSRLSRFGMMFKPLTESRGEGLLMWYREAFLAKTYPPQEREQESLEANPVCGNTWRELSMKYDPDLHSWKTVRCLFPEELQWSSVTLPRWGMTVNGVLFQHPTAVRPIRAIGSGSKQPLQIWPTPTAHMAKETNAPSEANRNEPTLASRVGGHLNPMWVEWLMGWPPGWTDLKPLGMDRFQSWQQQHSVYCEADRTLAPTRPRLRRG